MNILFLVLMFGSITACSPDTLYTVEARDTLVQITRPIVTQVTFTDNPAAISTDPAEDPQLLQEEIDSCIGRSLTEAEVKEYFRVGEIINTYEAGQHDVTRCYVYGNVVLKDGRTASFAIDLNRLGRMETSDGLTIDYYCNDCKNEMFDEACDRDCQREGL